MNTEQIRAHMKKEAEEMMGLCNEAETMSSIITGISYILDRFDILAWEKDKDGRYRYATESFCKDFYSFKLSDIKGMTDFELIERYRNEIGRHTFGELCSGTDDFTLNAGKACKFIEIGWRFDGNTGKDEIIVLSVEKKPVYTTGGAPHGIMGHARNKSGCAERIRQKIKKGILSGDIEVLEKKGDNVGVYHIIGGAEIPPDRFTMPG